ncbi:origin recognition complex subunit 5 C-terminus-domain-containing protein [Phycomyces nitens]|nr:origin recognition complex subunit 5 C-terminus-domain-containing protein [Phycomyces nitens]
MTNDMQEIQHDLEVRYPGRSKEISTLIGLMGNPADAVVPSVFIYGHPSSGKTSVVKAVMERTLERSSWAYANCVERYTPRMLFEHTLNQWCDWTPAWENKFMNVCKADTALQFVKAIQDGVMVDSKMTELGVESTLYLILDRAERLRDMPPTLLPVLLRLSEMTQRNVCVILISTVVFEKFRVKGGSYEPLFIRFSDYSKQDTLQIILMDLLASERKITVIPDEEDSDQEEKVVELDDDFFMSFAEIIYSIFNHNCKDLNELRYFSALLFPLYLQPVQQGRVDIHEKAKLFKFAQPYFAEATGKLYLREVSSAEWIKETHEIEEQDPTEKPAQSFLAHEKSGFDLPYYTKFLLLASYLASYNPARFDVRYFAKMGEERKKKKGGGTHKSRAGQPGGGKMRPQLLGPKSFPIERMLAIFYSIIDEPLEDTVDIQLQITSLTTLRLLVRSTSMDRLDAAKYKSNVSFEFIRAVSKSVRFEIEKYLYDFS